MSMSSLFMLKSQVLIIHNNITKFVHTFISFSADLRQKKVIFYFRPFSKLSRLGLNYVVCIKEKNEGQVLKLYLGYY